MNRKGWYSIIMQGVPFYRCVHQMALLVYGARVLANPDFYCQGEEEILLGNRIVQIEANVPVVLLGNPAYPMKQWL